MQSQNRVIDDLARVATSALGVATGLRQEAEARMREQFERVLVRMDMVSREEFEVVEAMARKAREDQAVLEERLAALEARLAVLDESKTPTAAGAKPSKTAAKSSRKAAGADAAETSVNPTNSDPSSGQED